LNNRDGQSWTSGGAPGLLARDQLLHRDPERRGDAHQMLTAGEVLGVVDVVLGGRDRDASPAGETGVASTVLFVDQSQ
jgi:hypothetical protein